ncbi:hypothetical protein K6119_10300 [Paracrocinitomix mangrovi]|uniref:hypothetical protein n=1 Tax=Paracrocinitomix mangrovi TaxID=2862509 RepID=UPI001C8D4953|nr:hypothetical protein [Paracrocinitomix mangrovi]UKN00124.1 hypothetical protein K6119_10300 [Paracrocinitomix mangrovi]
MRLLSFLFVMSTFVAFAQPDGWVQTDIGQGHLVVCKQKTKVGIWSNARGEFLEKPHNGHVIHLQEPQMLLDVNLKEKKVKVYHYYKGSVQLLEPASDSGKFHLGHILKSQWDSKLQTQEVDQKAINYLGLDEDATLLCVNPQDQENYAFKGEFNYYIKDNHLKLQFSHYNTRDEQFLAIPSVEYPGEDSIDDNGFIVYFDADEKMIFNSGCFDLNSGKWTIEPNYIGVNAWENIYGAYYLPKAGNKDSLSPLIYTYDFFSYDKKTGMQPTEHIKYQKFAFPLDLWPLKSEKVWYDKDSIYVYHKQKKGVGMFKIPLCGKSDYDGYSLEWLSTEGNFNVEEVFKPEYQYILHHGFVNYFESPNTGKFEYVLAAKEDNLFDVLFLCQGRENNDLKIDTLVNDIEIKEELKLTNAEVWLSQDKLGDNWEEIALIDNERVIRINPVNKNLNDLSKIVPKELSDFEYLPGWRFINAKWLSNGKIIANAHLTEDDEYLIPLMSEMGEDSMTVEGEFVYPLPEPGVYVSGVFDPDKSDWIIDPEHTKLSYNNGSYVAIKPILTETRNYKDSKVVVFNENNQIAQQFDYNDYIYKMDPKFLIPDEEILSTSSISPDVETVHYYKTKDGVGVARQRDIEAEIFIEPKEVMSYSLDVGAFYIEDGQMKFKVDDAIRENGEPIIFEIPNDSNVRVKIIGDHPDKYGYEYDPAKSRSIWWYKSANEENPGRLFYYFENEDSVAANYLFAIPYGYGLYADTLVPFPQDDFAALTEDDFMAKDFIDKRVFTEFEIKNYNEDLVKIKNNENDFIDEMIMESYEYPGEDSIDANGNFVFYPSIPGYFRTGVYSLKENKWVVLPENINVEWILGDKYLINEPILNHDGTLKSSRFILKEGLESKVLFEPILAKYNEKFSTYKLDDSLVVYNHYIEELPALPLFTEEGYDSTDVDGHFLYKEPVKGSYMSGIYDHKNDQWFIPEENFKIYQFKNAFVIAIPVLDENGFITDYKFQEYLKGDIWIKKSLINMSELPERYLEVISRDISF